MDKKITNLKVHMPAYIARLCKAYIDKANISTSDLFRAAIVEAAKQSDPYITNWKDIEREAEIKALQDDLKASRTEVKALTTLVQKDQCKTVEVEVLDPLFQTNRVARNI